ncbi:gastrula zinc finger protein XlCGF49.1-like [Vanessa cardui]|uniref:gastrula zinc finger protein XlCGF49.1-like n=1 Tax=Vanessa cardui TaxID=171605 RepID=UPI001F148679|nr:gastrula zinc finger protein XlCGF49.1-like [Vanessa cardui]
MEEKINEAPVFIEVAENLNSDDVEYTTVATKRIQCPECSRYTAENEEQLIRHIRKIHRGENPFQCAMCDYSTCNKVLFEEHVRIHQGIKPYKCSFCPHTNVSKKNLKKHELIHRPDNPLKCPNCTYIAKHRRGLACHKRKCHVADKDVTKCGTCDKVFDDKEALSVHKKTQKKCDECNHKTCTKTLLTVHKIMDHGKPDKRYKKAKSDTFKCALCDWSSNSKPRILLHLIHHPNQSVNEKVIDISILRTHGIMA